MKTKNLLMLLAIAGIMVFASCNKDETPAPLTKEEATAALTGVNTTYSADFTAFNNSEEGALAHAVDNLNLPEDLRPQFSSGPAKASFNGTISKSDFQQKAQKIFRSAKNPDDESPLWNFPWALYVGNTYTYNTNTQQWEPVANSTNNIIFIFSYNGGTNNAKLTYYDYAEKTGSFFGENITYTSQLKAKVEINNIIKYSWVYTASLSGTTSSISVSINTAHAYGTAYELTSSMSGTMTQTGLTAMTMNVSMAEELTKNGEILTAASFTVVMNETTTTSSMTVDAKYRIRDIVIKIAMNMNDNTNYYGNPDLYQTISIWTADGAKVADVIHKNIDSMWTPYLKFSDGTEVPLYEYLESLWEVIREFIYETMDFKR